MKILLCAENLLSEEQFPTDDPVSADEAASNHEAWHVATNRRHPSDRWEPTTANANHYLQRTFALPRGFDFCAIDRESNALGYPYSLTHSGDGFTTSSTVFSVTLPTVPGLALSDGVGCVTDEGAWLKTFSSEIARGIRLNSLAMGSGLVPQLTGVWIGKAWQPDGFVQLNHADDERYTTRQRSTESDAGWRGRGRSTRPRRGVLTLHLDSAFDYDMVRYHILGLMAAGFPAWIVWDRETGGRHAALVHLDGDVELDFGQKFDLGARRRVEVPFIEEQVVP